MSQPNDFSTWLSAGDRIRVSARAIIFNRTRDKILVEKNSGVGDTYVTFLGGGVEVGEQLDACLRRELDEEVVNAVIGTIRYLFVLENFIIRQNNMFHSLEHYFEVSLENENLTPKDRGMTFLWLPVAELTAVDLRPAIVRDRIVAGTLYDTRRLVVWEQPAP